MSIQPPALYVATAVEMAAAFYEEMKMTDQFPRGISQRKFVKKTWSQFLPVARAKLIEMLAGDYPEAMKAEILEAMQEESAMADAHEAKLKGRKLH